MGFMTSYDRNNMPLLQKHITNGTPLKDEDELISKKDTLAKFDPVSDWSAYQIIKSMPGVEKEGESCLM